MHGRMRLVVGLACLGMIPLLCGYVLMGGVWASAAIPVPYYTNPSATVAGWETSVRTGFQHWEDIANCTIAYNWRGQTARIATTSDGYNVVSNSADPARLGNGTLAMTTNWYRSSSNFTEFDMEWNQNYNWSTGGQSNMMDVESVATHEAGHSLGLDHTNIYEATMYPSTGAGEVFRRTLEPDDVNGALALYRGADVANGVTVSGRTTLDGVAFPGVSMTLGASAATSDASGNYSFANVANGTYTARATRNGYAFTPASRSVTVNGSNVAGQDFAGASTAAGTRYYTKDETPDLAIPDSGSVSSTLNIPDSISITSVRVYVDIRHTYIGDLIVSLRSPGGTTVTLYNRTGGSTQNLIGWYDQTLTPAQPLSGFNGQNAQGNWTLTVSDNEAQDVGTINLWKLEVSGSSGAAPTWSISGRVTSGGNGLALVSMALSGGSTTTTDATGNYTFGGLANGSYTVTPSLAGWTFTPANRAVTISSGNQAAQDFAATQPAQGGGGMLPVMGLGSGGNGQVEVLNGASVGFTTNAWATMAWATYNSAVGETRIATGDVDGDGRDELAIGIGRYTASGGWVAVYDDAVANFALLRWVRLPDTAYDARDGETWPAMGDVDGDGRAELVVGYGATGGGRALVFDDASGSFALLRTLTLAWSAYNGAVGEIHPACGDVDGDGKAEIVLGTGTYTSQGGWMEVVNDASSAYAHVAWLRLPSSAYNAANGKTIPACGDVDGDGKAELVVGMGTYTSAGGRVYVFDDQAAGFAALESLTVGTAAYNAANGETRPALRDADGDGRAELLVGFGRYGADGGRFVQLDDRTTNWGSPAAGRVHWSAYNSANGETWPAWGRFR